MHLPILIVQDGQKQVLGGKRAGGPPRGFVHPAEDRLSHPRRKPARRRLRHLCIISGYSGCRV